MPPETRLRIADVAVWYGERAGGITTYLDAKREYAARTDAFEHHLIVPGARNSRDGNRHEVPARVVTSNGYRIPLRTHSLSQALRQTQADIVLAHDRFWSLAAAGPVAADSRTPVVAVHHASAELEAAALPGPGGAYGRVFRRWERRAYERVNAVMSAAPVDLAEDRPVIPLRFGLDPAFRPQPGVVPADHVLYAGRLSREKGLDTLLAAAALSPEPWSLLIAGSGSAHPWVESLIRRHELSGRVSFVGFIEDRRELACAYAAASCVVVPGAHETFGLVILEAAASGGSVVAAANAPAAAELGREIETFPPGDPCELAKAIGRARMRRRDPFAAKAIADRYTWDRAFEAELADLEGLVR